MLKGIPSVLSPDLFKLLMEMGHGDEIVLTDGNFPAASYAQRLIRCDGQAIPELLEAILRFFPLDSYCETPVILMQVVPGDQIETPIWAIYQEIIQKRAPKPIRIVSLERFAFYERAKKAYAIVATSEKSLYANIILKKGVVVENG
jgi:L-fucose mutarotase